MYTATNTQWVFKHSLESKLNPNQMVPEKTDKPKTYLG